MKEFDKVDISKVLPHMEKAKLVVSLQRSNKSKEDWRTNFFTQIIVCV